MVTDTTKSTTLTTKGFIKTLYAVGFKLLECFCYSTLFRLYIGGVTLNSRCGTHSTISTIQSACFLRQCLL